MSDLVEVTGIVIASGPIGEYDKRVVLLTKELGKISAFARGARRPGNQLMAACESFAFGRFLIYQGRNSYCIEKAEIKNYFRELAADIESAYYGYYFLELADYFARENDDETQLIKLIYYSLKALLDERITNELVRAVYEFKLLVINGQYPDMFECVACGKTEKIAGFSIRQKGVVCSDCMEQKSVINISSSTLYTFQYIITTKTEKLYSFVVTNEVLSEMKNVMAECMAEFVDKKMKSIDILDMLN